MHLKNISKATLEFIGSDLPWSTILPRKIFIFLRRVWLYEAVSLGRICNPIRKTRRYYEIFTDFLNLQGKVNRKNAIWIYLILKLLSLFLYSRKVFKIKSSFSLHRLLLIFILLAINDWVQVFQGVTCHYDE